MKKRILYSIGAILSTAMPIAAVVSCGTKEVSTKQSWIDGLIGKSGSSINRLYIRALVKKLYSDKPGSTEIISPNDPFSPSKKVRAAQYKIFQVYRDQKIRTNYKYFTDQLIAWNKAGYIVFGDTTAPGYIDAKDPTLFHPPVINKELNKYHISPDYDWDANINANVFGALASSTNIGLQKIMDRFLIIQEYLTNAKKEWVEKSQTKDQKKPYFDLGNKNYFLIKYLVQKHPMFNWSVSYAKDPAKEESQLETVANWNKMFPDAGKLTRERTRMQEKYIIKTNLITGIDMKDYFGYAGIKSQIAKIPSENRMDFDIDTLKDYKTDFIKQGFVDKDGNINPTGKLNPETKVGDYVIQILPKYNGTNFVIPSFANPNDKELFIEWAIIQNSSEYTNAINLYRNAGYYSTSIWKLVQDQIVKEGINKPKLKK